MGLNILDAADKALSQVNFSRALVVATLGTLVVGNVAWRLRCLGVRDGYTRKFNHFWLSAISMAALLGLPDSQFVPTSVMTSLLVIAIYTASANSRGAYLSSIIRSNIRDRDEPRGAFFVFLPLITGQLAVYSALAFSHPGFAKIAFCSMGFGDGLAEPVGLRFGKHPYRVYDLVWRTWNTKSLEGSAAVFFVSLICCVSLLLGDGWLTGSRLLALAVSYSAFIAAVEALAPRGLDNMLIVGLGAGFLEVWVPFFAPGS